TLIETAPDAMIIADQQGNIVQVNSQTETLFGYNRQELLRLKIEDLVPQRFRQAHITHRAKFHTAPRRRGMGVGMELYGLRKDGTEFPVEISLSPFQTDDGLRVSSSIRDITERRRAEEERARLTAIVESSSDAIIRESLDGTIVSWNKGAERMLGYSATEVIGQKRGILVSSGADSESEFLDRLRHDQKIPAYDTSLQRRDGRFIDVSLSITPILDPSGRTIAATVVIQQTRDKKTQTATAKSRRE
ncbi:MAG TPA: PAS domain S-box protein, partial [Candidatus Bathyarchaeia archaeon]|nr:PAS domain S-box protein [Candidatus Bathyarchaeia archaeon]